MASAKQKNTAKDWPWPWTREDRENFETLVDCENAQHVIRITEPTHVTIAINKFLGLRSTPEIPARNFFNRSAFDSIEKVIGDSTTLGTTTEERYRKYLALVAQNPYYLWLSANPYFKRAYQIFSRKQQSPRYPGYRREWAELRLFRVASHVGFYAYLKHIGYTPRDPTAREVQQALSRTKALRQSLARGVRLESRGDTDQLSRLLGKLADKLAADQKKVYRKPRSDPSRIGREFVSMVSRQLLIEFNEASPEIVVNLARAMGYEADETAIERQIAAARKLHNRQAIAEALSRSR